MSIHADAATHPAAHGAAMTAQPGAESSEALLERILSSLDDDKAEDVVQINLRGKSEMADYMVICSGRSTRQVASISQNLVDRLKQEAGRLSKIEGKDSGDWVLIDVGDVIVHVFRPEVREFYQLEKMWQPATAAAESRPGAN
nr:ribosome silencing factor [Tropicimonas sp. IMCC34011]